MRPRLALAVRGPDGPRARPAGRPGLGGRQPPGAQARDDHAAARPQPGAVGQELARSTCSPVAACSDLRPRRLTAAPSATRSVWPRPPGRGHRRLLPVLRRLWAGEQVSHHGLAGDFDGVSVRPLPTQQPLEAWSGGMVASSLERCGRYYDGWLPSLCTPEEALAGRRVVESAALAAERQISDEHFGVSIGYAREPLDDRTLAAMTARARGREMAELIPIGLAALHETLDRFIEVGFSKFVLRPIVPPAVWPTSRRWPAASSICRPERSSVRPQQGYRRAGSASTRLGRAARHGTRHPAPLDVVKRPWSTQTGDRLGRVEDLIVRVGARPSADHRGGRAHRRARPVRPVEDRRDRRGQGPLQRRAGSTSGASSAGPGSCCWPTTCAARHLINMVGGRLIRANEIELARVDGQLAGRRRRPEPPAGACGACSRGASPSDQAGYRGRLGEHRALRLHVPSRPAPDPLPQARPAPPGPDRRPGRGGLPRGGRGDHRGGRAGPGARGRRLRGARHRAPAWSSSAPAPMPRPPGCSRRWPPTTPPTSSWSSTRSDGSVLELLPGPSSARCASLLSYNPETAGGLMSPDFLCLSGADARSATSSTRSAQPARPPEALDVVFARRRGRTSPGRRRWSRL